MEEHFQLSGVSIKAVELVELFILHFTFSVRHTIFALQSFQLLNTMEFEYGQIEAVKEPTTTYITLVIKQKVAYGIKFRKFNVWKVEYLKKQLGEALREGTSVKFATVKNGHFYNLGAIEECQLSECFGCEAYIPFRRHTNLRECKNCCSIAKKSKVDTELKLVKRKLVEYQYSLGLTLTFIDEKEEGYTNHLYVSTIFENCPNFEKLCELNVGDKKAIYGWLKEDNDSFSFLEITDISDIKDIE